MAQIWLAHQYERRRGPGRTHGRLSRRRLDGWRQYFQRYGFDADPETTHRSRVADRASARSVVLQLVVGLHWRRSHDLRGRIDVHGIGGHRLAGTSFGCAET